MSSYCILYYYVLLRVRRLCVLCSCVLCLYVPVYYIHRRRYNILILCNVLWTRIVPRATVRVCYKGPFFYFFYFTTSRYVVCTYNIISLYPRHGRFGVYGYIYYYVQASCSDLQSLGSGRYLYKCKGAIFFLEITVHPFPPRWNT